MARSRNRERRRLPREDDLRPRPRRGDERQLGADAFGALAHAGEAESVGRAVARHPTAIVGYRQPEAHTAHGAGAYDDAFRARMAHGVGERFLRDADDL